MIFYAHEDNIISYVCDWENSLKVCVLYNDFNTFYTQKTLKQNTSLDKFNYFFVEQPDTKETRLSVVILHIAGVNVTCVCDCPIKLHGTNLQGSLRWVSM